MFLDAEKSQCVKCHRVGDQGERDRPGADGRRQPLPRIHLIESILEPSRTIAPGFRRWSSPSRTAGCSTGVQVAETDDTLTLATSRARSTSSRKGGHRGAAAAAREHHARRAGEAAHHGRVRRPDRLPDEPERRPATLNRGSDEGLNHPDGVPLESPPPTPALPHKGGGSSIRPLPPCGGGLGWGVRMGEETASAGVRTLIPRRAAPAIGPVEQVDRVGDLDRAARVP